MPKSEWLAKRSPAFRLMIATSWLAPDSWRQNQEESIRAAIASGADWNEYLGLVDRHRTPALSWAAINQMAGIAIPDSVARELKERSDACRMDSVKQYLVMAELLKKFNQAAIPAMPLKGQVLSFDLYGDVGLRMSRDLDLAVTGDDFERARICLESMGWRLDQETWFPLTPRQWQSFLRHEHHLNFLHPRKGCELELHWRNDWETPEATSAHWARSIPSVWQGCSILAMRPSDLVLYLASHGAYHAWFRAKWLGDLARIHAAGLVDWREAMNEAQESGNERVLLATLGILEQVYELPWPGDLASLRIDRISSLIEVPLQLLLDSDVQETRSVPAKLRYRLRMSRYERLLRPEKLLRTSVSALFHCREDFRILPLPDRLFWAYKLLRPFLWAWRWARQTKYQGHKQAF
jgi:Uncharacterised nucleotidyltransferase